MKYFIFRSKNVSKDKILDSSGSTYAEQFSQYAAQTNLQKIPQFETQENLQNKLVNAERNNELEEYVPKFPQVLSRGRFIV